MHIASNICVILLTLHSKFPQECTSMGVDRYTAGSGHSSLVNRAAGVWASNLTRHGRVGTDTVHLGIIAVGLKWPGSAELR